MVAITSFRGRNRCLSRGLFEYQCITHSLPTHSLHVSPRTVHFCRLHLLPLSSLNGVLCAVCGVVRAHPEFCSLGVLRLRCSSPAMAELPACPCLPPHRSYECLLLRGTTAVYFIGPTLSHAFSFSFYFTTP
eukprot:COSAG01_NODE_6943_length_3429_cov_3.730030_6_plen_132_part_00